MSSDENRFDCSYDHPHILAGQGTIGLEIAEQVPDLDAVLVPVGGGGLLAGIALAIKTMLPNAKVYVRGSSSFFSYHIVILMSLYKPFNVTRVES